MAIIVEDLTLQCVSDDGGTDVEVASDGAASSPLSPAAAGPSSPKSVAATNGAAAPTVAATSGGGSGASGSSSGSGGGYFERIASVVLHNLEVHVHNLTIRLEEPIDASGSYAGGGSSGGVSAASAAAGASSASRGFEASLGADSLSVWLPMSTGGRRSCGQMRTRFGVVPRSVGCGSASVDLATTRPSPMPSSPLVQACPAVRRPRRSHRSRRQLSWRPRNRLW